MEPGELHAAVAEAIAEASRPWMPFPSGVADAAAAAAIRVVLAEVRTMTAAEIAALDAPPPV